MRTTCNIVVDLGIKNFNRIPNYIIIFICIAGYYITFIPHSNEEQYLALSKYYCNPEWILNSINLDEVSGTRFLYQCITGSLLNYFSFEKTVFIGRVILAILFSLSLGTLYKSLTSNNFIILIHLVLVYFNCQSYFMGSWIFLGLEAKCFSYVCVFFGLSFCIKNNYRNALLCMILATYFHVLVGGFVFIYMGLTILLFDKIISNREKILLPAIYALFVLPFLLYLKISVQPVSLNDPSVDWIYSYFRNEHHTIIFKSWHYFYDLHFRGVFKSILVCILLILAFTKTENKCIIKLIQFTLVTFVCSFVWIVVSAFDKEGVITKYYLFRINAISTFCATLSLVIIVYSRIQSQNKVLLNLLILLVSIFAIQRNAAKNLKKIEDINTHKDLAYEEMCQYIKSQTERDAVILYLSKDHEYDGHHDFIRKTERSRFVSHKFVPADFSKLPEWYDRIYWRRRLNGNMERFEEFREKYRVDYLFSKNTYPEYELIEERNPYKLYRLKSME